MFVNYGCIFRRGNFSPLILTCFAPLLKRDEKKNLIIIKKNKFKIQTGHRTNIFSAKFLPQTNSEKLISCSSSGDIYLTDAHASTLQNSSHHYQCHGDRPCYELRTFLQDPNTFVSCGQDGTCKWIDTRLA